MDDLIEAGRAARTAGMSHLDNPYFDPANSSARLGISRAEHLARLDAWAKGYNEEHENKKEGNAELLLLLIDNPQHRGEK